MEWAGVVDDDIAAAAAALPMINQIEVYYDDDDHDDEVRRRSFSASFDSIDRVGFEVDFLPVKRLRAEAMPFFRSFMAGANAPAAPSSDPVESFRRALQRPIVHRDATIAVAIPRRATTAAEVTARRATLLQQLSTGTGLTPLSAKNLLRQARREGVSPCARSYEQYLRLLARFDTPVEALLDVFDQARCDGVAATVGMLSIIAQEAATSFTTIAAAVALLLDHPNVEGVAVPWAATANAVAQYVVTSALDIPVEADLRRGATPVNVLPLRLSTSAFLALTSTTRFAPTTPVGTLATLCVLLTHNVHHSVASAPAADQMLTQAITVFRSSFADAMRSCIGSLDPSQQPALGTRIIAWLLHRLRHHTSPAIDRGAQRLAAVSLATELKLSIDGCGYESVFAACKADRDVRGVAFFLRMISHTNSSAETPSQQLPRNAAVAVIAAADFLADGAYDKDVLRLTHKTKSHALWDYVRTALLPDAATRDDDGNGGGGGIASALAAVSRLAAADRDVALAVELFDVATTLPVTAAAQASEHRRVLQAVVHASRVQGGSTSALTIPQDAVERIATLRPDVWNTFLRGLRTSAECIAKLESSPACSTSSSEGVASGTSFTPEVAKAISGGRLDAYVVVLDSSAWAALAVDAASAAAVAKQLQAYDEKGSGGVLLVGMEAILSALDDPRFADDSNGGVAAPAKGGRATIALLLAEWLRIGASWLRVVPLEHALAAASRNGGNASSSPFAAAAAVSPALWWTATWAAAMRGSAHTKVMVVTGGEPERDALTSCGFKPVVTVAELVKRLSGGK